VSYGESEFDDVTQDVVRELRRATAKFGPFVSGHEGIAILREEYLELEREVFWGKDSSKVRAEAIQVAAMAIRFIVDICDVAPKATTSKACSCCGATPDARGSCFCPPPKARA